MTSNPHKPSIIIFALCAFTIIGLWGLVFSSMLVGIFNFWGPRTVGFTPGMDFSIAGIAFFLSLLIVPSLIFSYRRMVNHPTLPTRFGSPIKLLVAAGVIWIIVLAVGRLLDPNRLTHQMIIPVFNILAFSIPVFFLIQMALRNAPTTNPQRPWGVLNYAMVGATTLSFVIETTIVVAIIIGVSVILMTKPQLRESLLQMQGLLQNPNPAAIDPLIKVLLSNRSTIYILLMIVSVATPLVEESVKPLGILLLRAKPIQPAEGFFLGVLSGAGFAVLESLMASVQSSGMEWAQLAVIRIGSDCMHILASGLMGWGFVSLFWFKEWKRFILNFLLAVGLHGSWNALAIVVGVNEVFPGVKIPEVTIFSRLAPALLFSLAVISLLVLLYLNKYFFQKSTTPVVVDNML